MPNMSHMDQDLYIQNKMCKGIVLLKYSFQNALKNLMFPKLM